MTFLAGQPLHRPRTAAGGFATLVVMAGVLVASVQEGLVSNNFENVNVYVSATPAPPGPMQLPPSLSLSLFLADTRCSDAVFARADEVITCDVAPLDANTTVGGGVGCLASWLTPALQPRAVYDYGFRLKLGSSSPSVALYAFDSLTLPFQKVWSDLNPLLNVVPGRRAAPHADIVRRRAAGSLQSPYWGGLHVAACVWAVVCELHRIHVRYGSPCAQLHAWLVCCNACVACDNGYSG